MQHWSEVCGVGPWFYTDRLPVAGFRVHLSIARANSAEVQLELTQQRYAFLAARHRADSPCGRRATTG